MPAQYGSSLAIIKALKGPNDPPTPGGPKKIEIATIAWTAKDVYFPSKNEVLVEWILSNFTKKPKHGEATPLLSLEWWSLLDAILSGAKLPTGSTSWFSSAVGKLSFGTIIQNLIQSLPSLVELADEQLDLKVSSCFQILWPLASRRLNVDLLSDCFANSLTVLFSNDPQMMCANSTVMKVCSAIAKSFRFSSASSSINKKKIGGNFVQASLAAWMGVIAVFDPQNLQENEIYLAGTDLVFSVDLLKGSSGLDDVLDALTTQTIQVLPPLFSSYLDATRRYRHALYGTSSGGTSEALLQTKLASGAFASLEAAHALLQKHEESPESWSCLLSILRILEEKSLNSSGAGQALSDAASRALFILEPSSKHDKVRTIALQILLVVARIDHDVVLPLLPKILSALSTRLAAQFPASLDLLSTLIAFHAKTRTLPSYVNGLLECLSSTHLDDVSEPKLMYRALSSCSLLDGNHLQTLSVALKSFITPGQTHTLIETALKFVENAGEAFDGQDVKDEDSTPKKKKRRKEENKVKLAEAATSFALVTRVVAIVIGSVSFENLTSVDHEIVISKIEKAGTILSDRAARATRCNWDGRLVASSALHLLHAIVIRPMLRASQNHRHEDDDFSKDLSPDQKDGSVVTEYTAEKLRQFFDSVEFGHIENDTSSASDAVELMLYGMSLVTNSPSESTPGWDGRTHNIDSEDGTLNGSIAIWSLALHRWLQTIDEISTEAQLDQFAELIFSALQSANPSNFEPGLLHVDSELHRAMQSGEFWDVSNLRAALERVLEKQLEPLDKRSPDKLLKKYTSGERLHSLSVSSQTISAIFRFLLQAPPDYFARAARLVLLRRAVSADISFSQVAQKAENEEGASEARLLLRKWMRGQTDILSSIEVDWGSFALFLARSTSIGDRDGECTLSLLYEIFRLIHRPAGAARFPLSRLFEQLSGLISTGRTVGFGDLAVCKFFEFMGTDGPAMNVLDEEESRLLTTLHQLVAERTRDRMTVIANPGPENEDNLIRNLRCIKASITFGKYLGCSASNNKLLDIDFANKLNAYGGNGNESVLVEVFAVVVEQVRCSNGESREDKVEKVVAAYAYLSSKLSDMTVADEGIRRMCKSLSKEEYVHVLAILDEAFAAEVRKTDLEGIVRLARISSMYGPEGTSKDAHLLFQDFLQAFLGEALSLQSGPILYVEALDFLRSHSTERALSLSSSDVGNTCTFLSKTLSPSDRHSPTTHAEILHGVVAVMNALIRYRRDLVATTIPHLGMVLRLLISSLRTVREDLGARQSLQISNSLPWWIASSSGSLGVAEARAIARLLTTLQAKTIPIVRTHESREQKAESLARPFSKHAPYVLTAYIDAMNDPLCSIPLPLRRELEPGLFALCDMMTEHGRDAIMVSALDSGGKTTLKLLWKEYEKQRYVGKG